MNSLTQKEFRDIPMNSQMRHLLIQCLSNEALSFEAEDILRQCQHNRTVEPTTYEEGMLNSIVPEMIKRLRKLDS